MKISIQELWHNIIATTRRFPLVVADSVIVTLLALSLYSLSSKSTVMQELILTAMLGFPLLLSFTLFAERRAWPEKRRMLFFLPALLFLAVYYFFLTFQRGKRGRDKIRSILSGVSFLSVLRAVYP